MFQGKRALVLGVANRRSIAWAIAKRLAAGGAELPTLAPVSTKPNPDLRWEQKTALNLGLDAALLGNRVTLALDAYRSVTKDLLLSVTLPSTTGYTNQLRNVGSVRNLGMELTVSTVNIQKERFSWRSTLNLAGNRNKVLDLGTALDASGNVVPLRALNITPRTGNFFSPGDIYIVRVGEPLSSIYGYMVTGLWQQGDRCYLRNPATNCVPGEYKIADLNGDSAITAADRTILGGGDPKFYGGLSNTLTFGPFSLDAFLSFNYGNKIINGGNASPSCRITSGRPCSTAGRRNIPARPSRAPMRRVRVASTARWWRTGRTCDCRPSRSATGCRPA